MNSGPVVSNTTPLINLAGIGLLDLLPRLYGNIVVPRIVVTEYQMKMDPSDPDLSTLSWLTVIENAPIDPALPSLGAGETAAIALAKALSARFILIDERKARRIASNQGLMVAGTLGVLTRAKDQGLVSAIKPHIEAMEAQGRYFGEALIEKVLRDVGE